MPFHTPQFPWLKIDHKRGEITCTRCDATATFSPIGGLELLIDTLRPFARQHADCQERPKATPTARPGGELNA